MGLTNLVDFHIEINQLKQTLRYNTCKKSMQESTADHSWKLALLALDTIDKLGLQVNPIYSVKLALVHDLCEYQATQDIDSTEVANGKISKQQKHNLEESVIKELSQRYNRQDIYDAWIDYEEGKTPEAKYIRALDKMEALIHITERGERGRNYDDADHIALYADEAVLKFPDLIPLLREVKLKLKKTYPKQGMEWKPEYDRV